MRESRAQERTGQRFSVRASISLWMLLAGLIWAMLGVAFTYATRSGDQMEAAGHSLSTIAPAAGSASPAVKP